MQQSSSPDVFRTATPIRMLPMPRPDRPCDACRRRKTRCVIDPGNHTSCVMCAFHNRPCTFVEEALPRKRQVRSSVAEDPSQVSKRPKSTSIHTSRRHSDTSDNTPSVVADYASLQGESLLKKTLGLQSQRYASYIGLTDINDRALLRLRSFDNAKAESLAEDGSFRRVAFDSFFYQRSDFDQPADAQTFGDVDEIESIVKPYGKALIRLYFRIVHPTYPILHKKVYLEKYGRSHREFSPPLLAAVYITALNWWSYSSELVKQQKPNVRTLESLALRSFHDIANRAKISTVQAGLLLLQQPNLASWSLTCTITGIAQDLGLHLDSSNWRIPFWEQGLRKRVAWAVYMQDKWSALIYGRPSHISSVDWNVKPVTSNDFPESAADEDDEDGSTEVEKGRSLFSAMIALTKMLSDIIEKLYSLKAETEVSNAPDGLEVVFTQAKPIQLQLKSWYAEIPESLRLNAPSKLGKLNSVGYLHLAYFAAEISIHRRVINSLSHSTDPYLIEICRSAAKSRLIGALEFFERLKPEQLQSFWYFASSFNITLMGTFAGLCMVTSLGREEMIFYHTRLQELKWTLRVRSTGHMFLEKANTMLLSAVDPLLRPIDEIVEVNTWSMMTDQENPMGGGYGGPLDHYLNELNTDYAYPTIMT